MAVTTGRWGWGWRVTTSNQTLNFDCATHAGPYSATLRLGDYGAGLFATEVARAMNAAHPGAGDAFTCVFDFDTGKFTIDNGSRSLTLLQTSTALGLLGFADADTASASGHTSTDTIGTEDGGGNDYFYDAGVYSWAPSEPAVTNTPVTAAADGSTALLLQRRARTVQHETDGGLRESIYFSTDKFFRIQYRYLSSSEQTKFERLLDWLEKGAPADFRPDDTAASTINMRLVLANPGDFANTFSWPTRAEADYPELVLIQQLSRT